MNKPALYSLPATANTDTAGTAKFPVIDRTIANRLNPFISHASTADSLELISGAMKDLAYCISTSFEQCDEAIGRSAWMFTDAMSAALDYERETLTQAKNAGLGHE